MENFLKAAQKKATRIIMSCLSNRLFLTLILICLADEVKASDVLLQCMDAKGVEKIFVIFKDTEKVQFSSANGRPIGAFRETSTEYFFTFPKTATRSEAMVKFNRYTGMVEFETGKPPFLSILWTANCSEIPHIKKF